jgi:rhodanese-related sulfurtransferase
MGQPGEPVAAMEINPLWEVHPAQVKECLDKKVPMLLLDVRRQGEWDTVHLPGARLVPLDQLHLRLEELESWKDRRVVVYCHHGVRSLRGTKFLRDKGFTDIHSMAGGIDAWSLIVDPALRRY